MDMACMACFQDHVKRRAMPPNLKCRVILPSGATSISIWDASSKEDLQGWLDENLAACEPGLVNTVHEVQVRPDPGLLLTAHAVMPMHPCMSACARVPPLGSPCLQEEFSYGLQFDLARARAAEKVSHMTFDVMEVSLALQN